jgi:hypothetical protein
VRNGIVFDDDLALAFGLGVLARGTGIIPGEDSARSLFYSASAQNHESVE